MILSFDIGSTLTKALLFSEEGPLAKVIVPTSPDNDIEITAKRASFHLEKKSGFNLIKKSGEFLVSAIACSSVGGGLNALAASSIGSVSGRAASLVLSHSGTNVVGSVSNDDGLTFPERVRSITNLNPDIILLAGGTEGECIAPLIEIAKTVAYAVRLMNPRGNIPVVYAGNSKAQRTIDQMLSGICKLEIVPNIMPDEDTLDIYPAVDEIKDMSNKILSSKNLGWSNFFQMLSEPLVPSSLCLLKAAESLPAKKHLTIISSGSSSSELITVMRENKTSSPILKRYSSPCGVGIKAMTSYNKHFSGKSSAWLQQDHDPEVAENIVRKRSSFPAITPGIFENELLHSLSAEILCDLAQTAFENIYRLSDDIFAASYLFSVSKPEKVYETVLNCIQPTGFSRIHVDEGYLTNYGLMKLFDEGFSIFPDFRNTCPVVSLGFNFKNPGTDVAQIVFSANGENVSAPIKSGELKFLDPGFSEAEVTVIPARSVDAGAGAGVPSSGFVKMSEAGILIDSRGRPLYPELYRENWFPSLQSWKKNLSLRAVL